MKNNRTKGTAKTNFWTNGNFYVPRRSAQSFLNPEMKTKVVANSECLSGCNNSCGTSCATGCTDF